MLFNFMMIYKIFVHAAITFSPTQHLVPRQVLTQSANVNVWMSISMIMWELWSNSVRINSCSFPLPVILWWRDDLIDDEDQISLEYAAPEGMDPDTQMNPFPSAANPHPFPLLYPPYPSRSGDFVKRGPLINQNADSSIYYTFNAPSHHPVSNQVNLPSYTTNSPSIPQSSAQHHGGGFIDSTFLADHGTRIASSYQSGHQYMSHSLSGGITPNPGMVGRNHTNVQPINSYNNQFNSHSDSLFNISSTLHHPFDTVRRGMPKLIHWPLLPLVLFCDDQTFDHVSLHRMRECSAIMYISIYSDTDNFIVYMSS